MSDLTARIGATVSDNGAFRFSSENLYPSFEHNGTWIEACRRGVAWWSFNLCDVRGISNLVLIQGCVMVVLLPSVLAAALLCTLDSHGHSAKKKSYASASACVRVPFNDMDEFNFAQWMRGFLLLLLLNAARPSGRPEVDFRDSHCGCVVIIAYHGSSQRWWPAQRGLSVIPANILGQRKCLLLLIVFDKGIKLESVPEWVAQKLTNEKESQRSIHINWDFLYCNYYWNAF